MAEVREQQVDVDEIDLGQMFRAILSSWRVIVVCVSLTLILSIFYLRETADVYSADGLVQIEEGQSTSDLMLGALSGMAGGVASLAGLTAKSPSDTEIQLLKSRFILGRVIQNLNLDILVTDNGDKWYNRLLHVNSKRIINSKDGVHYSSNGLEFDVRKFEVPFPLLDQKFKISFLNNGRYTLELLDKSKIPGFEQQELISGAVGSQLNMPLGGGVLQLFIQKSDSKIGSVYLEKRSLLGAVKDINDNFLISEKGKQTGVLALIYNGDQRLVVQTLNEVMQVYLEKNIENRMDETQHTLDFLSRQLPQSKADLEAAEDRYNKFREKNNTIDPTQEVQLLLQQIVDLKTKKGELQQQSALLDQKYTSKFPLAVATKSQLDVVDGELKELESKTAEIPNLQRQYLQVYRDVQVNTALYTSLLNSYQQLKVMRAGKVATVRILDDAVMSEEPIKPKKIITLFLAVLLGVVSGVGFILLRNKLFSGVKDSSIIEAKTGLPVLATIPRSESQRKIYLRNAKKLQLLAKVDPEDMAVEGLKSLRTVVHFASTKAWNNVILITGPSPEIGKSFISANLATVFAQMGKRVVLVDADMRRGTLKSYFTVEKKQGLSDYLKDSQIPLDAIVVGGSVDGLDFISRGEASNNPAELLLAERFKSLVETLSAQYDYVLIDSPPVLAATDAAILAQVAGMTLVVARYAYTHIKELDIAISRLTHTGASVHGVVFNDVRAGDGYGYQYAYQYRSSN